MTMGKAPKDRSGRRAFIKHGVAAGVGATTLAGIAVSDADAAATAAAERRWTMTADVVVLGAGAAGLPAAIAAADAGASVIVVEANFDIGGRQMLNGGQVVLGG